MSKNKMVFVLKLLWSVERQTQDMTISLKVRCTIMFSDTGPSCNPTGSHVIRPREKFCLLLEDRPGGSTCYFWEESCGGGIRVGEVSEEEGQGLGARSTHQATAYWVGLSPTETQPLYLPGRQRIVNAPLCGKPFPACTLRPMNSQFRILGVDLGHGVVVSCRQVPLSSLQVILLDTWSIGVYLMNDKSGG